MTKEGSSENFVGATFADLYDAQQQQDNRPKPIGRPKKKVPRKPRTLHLTKDEDKALRWLELTLNEYTSINRSEITGIALDIFAELIKAQTDHHKTLENVEDVEVVRRRLKDLLLS